MVSLCTTKSNIKSKFYILPQSVILCCLCVSKQRAVFSIYNFKWLILMTETQCVYCAVRPEYLHVPEVYLSSLKGFGNILHLHSKNKRNTQVNNYMVFKYSINRSLRKNNLKVATSIQNFILSQNSTCFSHLLCPSSAVISCTRGNFYVSCRLFGWNNLTFLGSGHVTCMKHTNCHVYSW
jgi:hypothetical protein